MPRPTHYLAAALLLPLAVADATAMGFGRIGNATTLGQPLNMTVAVRLDADESLGAECLSAEVYSGESRLPASTVKVAIEPGGDPAERTVRITTGAVIDEPVVSVSLDVGCTTRLSRKFVAFVDPPVINLAQTTEPAPRALPEPSAPVQREAHAPSEPSSVTAGRVQAAPAPAQAAPKRREPPPSRSAVAVGAQAPKPAPAAARPSTPRSTAPAPKAARAPATEAGARLKLEPVEHGKSPRETPGQRTASAAPPPPPPASAASVVAAPASAPDEAAAQRAKEQEQLLALQDNLARLRAESRTTQEALLQLQARLREADSQRYANPLVFALAAIVAALAAVVGVLLWKRANDKPMAPPSWWAPLTGASASTDASATMTDHDWFSPKPVGGPPVSAQAQATAAAETTAAPRMLPSIASLEAEDGSPPAAAPGHEMSVEELIDLEQQAEFFVALGQDDAAVDLLLGHVRNSGDASPLPYLKLLEIHRRRGDREAFERVREPFNRRFNAYVHDWDSDPQMGRTLLDYPKVSAKLQSLWGSPKQTMKAIEASIFRRDADSPTFELPAYRELLFLYSIARDLSEREATTVSSVDVLLPIGSDTPDPTPSVTRLHPTPRAEGPAETSSSVDVDISRFEEEAASGRPSGHHIDFSTTSGLMGLFREPEKKPGE